LHFKSIGLNLFLTLGNGKLRLAITCFLAQRNFAWLISISYGVLYGINFENSTA